MSPSLFPAATASLRRPSFELDVGDDDTLLELTVEAGLGPAVDALEVILADPEGAAAVAIGDDLTLALGYEDDGTEAVFSGRVESVGRGLDGRLRLTAVNGGSELSRLRVNQSYEQQSAGKIVEDLAGTAGVATGEVADGVELPFYVVDDRRTALEQIVALARSSGCLVFFDGDGKLHFVTPGGSPAATFTYGDNLLDLRTREGEALPGGFTVVGEGAAGSEGSEAWSWLLKDPAAVTAEAGGDPVRRLSEPALRSTDAATTAAEGRTAAAARLAVTGTLLAPGTPEAMPGVTVEVAGSPGAGQDGEYLVSSVRHTLSKARGFMSEIRIRREAAAGGGLP